MDCPVRRKKNLGKCGQMDAGSKKRGNRRHSRVGAVRLFFFAAHGADGETTKREGKKKRQATDRAGGSMKEGKDTIKADPPLKSLAERWRSVGTLAIEITIENKKRQHQNAGILKTRRRGGSLIMKAL